MTWNITGTLVDLDSSGPNPKESLSARFPDAFTPGAGDSILTGYPAVTWTGDQFSIEVPHAPGTVVKVKWGSYQEVVVPAPEADGSTVALRDHMELSPVSASEASAIRGELASGLAAAGKPILGHGSPDPDSGEIGDVYIDLDSTNGASVWRRLEWEWIVERGDTGWQDIGGALSEGYTKPTYLTAMIRRVNETIYISAEKDAYTTSAPADLYLQIPVGFAPGVAVYVQGRGSSGVKVADLSVDSFPSIRVRWLASTADQVSLSCLYPAGRSWPTSLTF